MSRFVLKDLYLVLSTSALFLLSESNACAKQDNSIEFSFDPDFVQAAGEDNAAVIKKFNQEINDSLPAVIKSRIKYPIHFQFSKLDDTTSIELPKCVDLDKLRQDSEYAAIGLLGRDNAQMNDTKNRGAQVFGQTSRIFQDDHIEYRIELNRNFIPVLFGSYYSRLSTAQTSNCGYANANLLLKATVIHEIGHVFDMESGNISSSTPFLNVALWSSGVFSDSQKNYISLRSPDSYEDLSPAEYFAVNLEHFILDSEYACRRPSLHGFYVELFESDPLAPTRHCKVNTVVPHSFALLPLDLNPDRVYQIHYLIGGKGDSLEGHWGHSMIRIIGCAPQRTAPGPECLEDIAFHTVISFRADPGGIESNHLDLLLGKTPAEAFVFSFGEIMEEYNFGQARDIYSVPIQLNRQQLKRVIYAAVSRIWEYQGRYFFFTNNCATETVTLLKSALPNSSSVNHIESLVDTPMGLLEGLIKNKLATVIDFKSDDSLFKYYFPSYLKTAGKRFDALLAQGVLPQGLTIDKYFALSAEARIDFYYQAKAILKGKALLQVNSDFYQLELAQRDHLEMKLEKELKDAVIKMATGDFDPKISRSLIVKIKEHLIYRTRLTPKLLAQRGYGIPVEFDFDKLIHSFDYKNLERTMQELRKAAKQMSPEVFSQSEAVARNMKILTQDSTRLVGLSTEKIQSELKAIELHL